MSSYNSENIPNFSNEYSLIKNSSKNSTKQKIQNAEILENYYKEDVPQYDKDNISQGYYQNNPDEAETTPFKIDFTSNKIDSPEKKISYNINSSQSDNPITIPKLEFEKDIKAYLSIREEEMRKATKRRKSIMKRRYSQRTQNKSEKSINMEITDIIEKISKIEIKTSFGKYKESLKFIDLTIALVVIVNIIISIIDNELYITYSDDYLKSLNQSLSIDTLNEMTNRKISYVENFLRFLNIGIVITGFFLVISRYVIKLRLLKSSDKLSKHDNIFSSGLYKYMFCELILIGIFYPPFLNNAINGKMLTLYFSYNYNSIISVFIIMKSYLVIRVYSYFSRWTSESASSIGKKFNINTGLSFAFKAELKKRPYTALFIALVISLAICSFLVRTFEYPVINPEKTNSTSLKGENNELQSLQNCFWLIIITMLTVGYGDVFPRSHMGRAVVILASILGMLLVSLIVVSLAVLTEFSDEEKKAYNIIKKLHADSCALDKATNVLVSMFKMRNFIEEKKRNLFKGKNNIAKRFVIISELKERVAFFKNDMKIAASLSIPVEDMLKLLEDNFTRDLKELNSKLDTLSKSEKMLEKLENLQEELSDKMDPILKRQERIAKYIVDLNNKNFIKIITKKKQKKLIKYNETQIMRPTLTSKFLFSQNEKNENRFRDRNKSPNSKIKGKEIKTVSTTSLRKKKNGDILFTDNLN